MKKIDYIIVGQGLAGSLLAYELLKKEKKILVIDSEEKNTASKVAVGLVNPITGKRLVKSWLIDELIPYALNLYGNLEEKFDETFVYHKKIARLIPNEDIFQQWKVNFDQAVEEGYIDPEIKTAHFGTEHFSYFIIRKSFWLNTIPLLKYFRDFFDQKQSYLRGKFIFNQLKISETSVQYDNYEASGIIFCEGPAGVQNPYFKYLPFNLNKGEVIDIKMPDFQFDHILKKNIFILPTENHQFKVGSTYDRDFKDSNISAKAVDYFSKKMGEITSHKFQILDQKAALRPATIDRRPFIGTHPKFMNLYIFNGFGAKGVSLIPYFSSQMAEYLDTGTPLHPEASIDRFL